MANINFEVRGFGELIKHLDQYDPAIRKAKRRAMRAGADVLLKQMLENAEPHRRSGLLSSKIRIRARSSGDAIDVGVFGNEAPHAHLVEHGHGGPKPAPAYPFMETAYHSTEDEVTDAILRTLEEELP